MQVETDGFAGVLLVMMDVLQCVMIIFISSCFVGLAGAALRKLFSREHTADTTNMPKGLNRAAARSQKLPNCPRVAGNLWGRLGYAPK